MTRQISRSTRQSAVRALLLEALGRDVAELVRHEHHGALEDALDDVGFMSNRVSESAELGAAIVALAPTLDVEVLAEVAHTAAFYRAWGKRAAIGWWATSAPHPWRARTRRDRALRVADETLAGAGAAPRTGVAP